MSSTPTGRSADIQRLVTAGYSIEIQQNHLLMDDVPYVDESRQVRPWHARDAPYPGRERHDRAELPHRLLHRRRALHLAGEPDDGSEPLGTERTGPRVARRPELLEQAGQPRSSTTSGSFCTTRHS